VFQGLVYCRGGLKADHVTVVGCLIQDGGSSPVELNDVQLYYTSATAAVSYQQQASYLLTFTNADVDNNSQCQPASSVVANIQTGVLNTQQTGSLLPTFDAVTGLSTGASDWPLTRYCRQHMLVTVTKRGGRSVYTIFTRLRDETIYTFGGIDDPGLIINRDNERDLPVVRQLLPDSPWQQYPPTGLPGGVLSIYEYNDLGSPNNPDDFLGQISWSANWCNQVGLYNDLGLYASGRPPRSLWRDGPPSPLGPPIYDSGDSGPKTLYGGNYSTALQAIVAKDQTGGSTMGTAEKVNLVVNPSRFLSPADRMRLLYWGDL
jgi:hypothetical protein